MMKPVLLTLSALAGLAAAAPALAQQNDRQLIIYGNDKCPEGTICVRAPESERFRIPQTLRSGTLAPADQPWAARASSVARAGSSGTGSCSSGGASGGTGCWQQMMKEARDERKQQNAADAASAEPK